MRKDWFKSGWLLYWAGDVDRGDILETYARIAEKAQEDPVLGKLQYVSAARILDAAVDEAGFGSSESLVDRVFEVRDRIYSIEADRAIHCLFSGIRPADSDRTRPLINQIELLRPQRKMLEREAGTGSGELASYVIPLVRSGIKTFRKVVISFAVFGVVSHRWGSQVRCRLCYRASIPRRKYCREHVVYGDNGRQDNSRRHATRAREWLKRNEPFGFGDVMNQPGKRTTLHDVLHAEDVPKHFSLSDPKSAWTSASQLRGLAEMLNSSRRVAQLLGRRPIIPNEQVEWLRQGLDPDFMSTSIHSWTEKIRVAEIWLEALEKTERECRRGRPVSTKSKTDRQHATKWLRDGVRISEVARRLKRNRSTIKTWIDRGQIKVS